MIQQEEITVAKIYAGSVATPNDTIDQMDFRGIYRICYPTATEYIVFSVAHGTVSKTDALFGHKAHINTYKKIERISYILSNHNGIKLEISKKRGHLWVAGHTESVVAARW
jgi:hypothetical protein